MWRVCYSHVLVIEWPDLDSKCLTNWWYSKRIFKTKCWWQKARKLNQGAKGHTNTKIHLKLSWGPQLGQFLKMPRIADQYAMGHAIFTVASVCISRHWTIFQSYRPIAGPQNKLDRVDSLVAGPQNKLDRVDSLVINQWEFSYSNRFSKMQDSH